MSLKELFRKWLESDPSKETARAALISEIMRTSGCTDVQAAELIDGEGVTEDNIAAKVALLFTDLHPDDSAKQSASVKPQGWKF